MRPHREQIPVRTPATKQLNKIITLRKVSHFTLKFSWTSYPLSPIASKQVLDAAASPWNVERHPLLGNSAHTYARTPLKWGSQNYTFCPCWSHHGSLYPLFVTSILRMKSLLVPAGITSTWLISVLWACNIHINWKAQHKYKTDMYGWVNT